MLVKNITSEILKDNCRFESLTNHHRDIEPLKTPSNSSAIFFPLPKPIAFSWLKTTISTKSSFFIFMDVEELKHSLLQNLIPTQIQLCLNSINL